MSTDYFPVGAIVAQASTLPESQYWMLCNGDVLAAGDYPELFNVLGYTYGGDEAKKEFKLPDYQGMFLRGAGQADGSSVAAQDRFSRHPRGRLREDGVGTVQTYATKKPNGSTFKANFSHLPTDSKGTHGVTKDNNTAKRDAERINTCTGGGDKESRPRNVYVNYYIKVRA